MDTLTEKEPCIFSFLSNTQSQLVKELITKYVELFANHSRGKNTETDVDHWAKKNTGEILRLGLTLYQSIQTFTIIKEVTWDQMKDFSEGEENVSARQIHKLGRFINDFIGHIILSFTDSFTRSTNLQLQSQQEAIDELSTPVISIVDGVAVLPIIGEIDTRRSRIIMEQSLHETDRQGVECLIIDLSGVYIVDTMVAQELFKIISSLELTGVEVNITGIRPELAHSIVNLGINFDNITLYNNPGQAMKDFGIYRK